MDVLRNDNQFSRQSNTFSNVSPGDIGPASNSPCSSEVTVCCIESAFVQETMLPVGTLI